MPLVTPNVVAGGNIYPSRFVKLDPTADSTTGPAGSFVVLQATANDRIFGISNAGSDYPPINDTHVTVGGYAAVAGEQLNILGECEVGLLELSGTVATDDWLKSDADGKGVSVATSGTTKQNYGARALQSGVATNKILVQVERGAVYPALA